LSAADETTVDQQVHPGYVVDVTAELQINAPLDAHATSCRTTREMPFLTETVEP